MVEDNPTIIALGVITFFLIGVGMGYMGGYIDSEDTYTRPEGCFDHYDLGYECRQDNGTLTPVTDETGSYWTCSTMDYKVRAC